LEALVVLGQDGVKLRSDVTLENWQAAPQLYWSFQHVEDLFPTALISRGSGPVADLPSAPQPLSELVIEHPDGTAATVAEIMASTETDGWIVTRGGRVLAEQYPQGMPADTRHLLMSVSKSLVGIVVGSLTADGELEPDRLVTDYVPSLEESGYAGATVRHLLDMRSGIQFSEDYLNPDAEVRTLEEAIGWAPRRNPLRPRTMYDFLVTLVQKGPHGGPFEYRSGETDVLGWVCEAAAGIRMPELMSRLLWAKLGCEHDAVIGVDSVGTGMFDGGVCAALRDLARFGAMLVQQGVSLTGEQVVPASWIEDTLLGGSDSREAFAASPTITLMPGGMYRNQFWLPYPDRRLLLCLGIHGQMIYADCDTEVVAAKLSAWPEPQHAEKLFSTLRAFDTIAALG
jgi:CubicO group peptidase (beta-lactamase class C family)